jgi:hypothetical protein
MAKFRQESGRLRYTEKSFELPLGGERPADCQHGWSPERGRGWYTKSTRRSVCVFCSKPEAECEAEIAERIHQDRVARGLEE